MRQRCWLMLPVLALAGCFSYIPTNGTALRQGQGVTVLLSVPQDVKLQEVTANNVVRVQGEVIQSDTQALSVSAALLVSSSGYEQLGEGATIVIPRRSIQRLTERRVSMLRSVGLAVLAVGATAAIARGTISGSTSRNGGGQPPGGQ